MHVKIIPELVLVSGNILNNSNLTITILGNVRSWDCLDIILGI